MLFRQIIVVQTYFEHFLGADSENHSHFAQKLVVGSQHGGSWVGHNTEIPKIPLFCIAFSGNLRKI